MTGSREQEALARLRADIEAGLRELDAGLGAELDIEEFLRQARRERATNDRRQQ